MSLTREAASLYVSIFAEGCFVERVSSYIRTCAVNVRADGSEEL